jgi:energy-coupling factor transport system permease protein
LPRRPRRRAVALVAVEEGVHPLVRVVVVLVFIAGMALARPLLLVAGGMSLLLAFTLTGFPALPALLGMVRRLRWLLLAILIVYGWWTPGDFLIADLAPWSPTLQGLELGFLRIAALVCIVSAVHLLIQVTERGQLLAALLLITGPLLRPPAKQRFAVRLLLTLEAVAQVQVMVREVLGENPGARRGLSRLSFYLKKVYAATLERALQATGMQIELADPVMPPMFQWLIPLLLAAGIWLLLNL